jgi:hypothetical protein
MTAAAVAGAAAGSDAIALVRLLREAVAAAVPREALLLRLGNLAPQLRQPHRRRLVDDALDLLRGVSRIRLFSLPNADIVVVAPVGTERLREAEAALRTLLCSEEEKALPVARLRLPEEAASLFAAVETALVPNPVAPPPPLPTRAAPVRGGQDAAAFTTETLASMERGLAGADLSAFLRQRPVCRLGPDDAEPEVAWRTWRVSLRAVFAALAPPGAADPAACPPWLLRRLQRTLDRRLLAAFARHDRAAELGAAALCLSPGSVGTSEFARFAEALGPVGRAEVLIGMRAEDILADPEGFAAARDGCRTRGFRTALMDAEAAMLPLLPPHRLDLHRVQLRWSPDLPAVVAAASLPAERDAVVLSGADTAAAIGWGWGQGIALFEGRLLRPRRG